MPGIAEHIGIGRAAGAGLGDAVRHNAVPILPAERDHLQRHPRLLAHLPQALHSKVRKPHVPRLHLRCSQLSMARYPFWLHQQLSEAAARPSAAATRCWWTAFHRAARPS